MKGFSLLLKIFLALSLFSTEPQQRALRAEPLESIVTYSSNTISRETSFKTKEFLFNSQNCYLEIRGQRFCGIKHNQKNPGKIVVNDKGIIEKASFENSEKSQYFTISCRRFYCPRNAKVEYFIGKPITIQTSENIDFSSQEFSSLKADSFSPEIVYVGKNLNFGTQKIDGEVGIDNDGDIFIAKKSLDKINFEGLKIDYRGNDARIYLGQSKKDNVDYIYFGKKFLKCQSMGQNLAIEFLEGNNYIKVDNGDKFSIILKNNSMFLLTHQSYIGDIPWLLFKGNGEIRNGSKSIEKIKDNVRIKTIESLLSEKEEPFIDIIDTAYGRLNPDRNCKSAEAFSTTPLEIKLLRYDNSEFNGAIYTKRGKFDSYNGVIFIDNFNRIFFCRYGKDLFIEGERIKVPKTYKENYPTVDEVSSKTKISILFSNDIKKGFRDVVLGRLNSYWEEMSEEMKKSMSYIFFADTQEYGGFGDYRYSIFAPSHFCKSTFYHEFSHSHDFSLSFENLRKYLESGGSQEEYGKYKKEYLEKLEQLKEYFLKDLTLSTKNNNEFYQLMSQLSDARESVTTMFPSEFKNKWNSINSYQYGSLSKNFYEWKVDDDVDEDQKKVLTQVFGYLWRNRPLYGRIGPYGDSNANEDVATYVAELCACPKLISPLININHPDNKLFQLYHKDYLKRIELLKEYKFITDRQYQQLFIISGLKPN